MTDLLIPPPFPAPWDANREGAVSAADTTLIGYIRYDRVGNLPQRQAAARWWAASPDLADATAGLALAGDKLLRAAFGKDDLDAAARELARATERGRAAVARLLDPQLRNDTPFNTPVHAVLQRWPGASS